MSEIEVLAGLVPGEGGEGQSFLCLPPSFWPFAGPLWHCLTCDSVILIFSWCSPCCPCVQISPFCNKDTSHIAAGALHKPRCSHFD